MDGSAWPHMWHQGCRAKEVVLVRQVHTGLGKNGRTGRRSSQTHRKMDEDKTSPKHIYLHKFLVCIYLFIF